MSNSKVSGQAPGLKPNLTSLSLSSLVCGMGTIMTPTGWTHWEVGWRQYVGGVAP